LAFFCLLRFLKKSLFFKIYLLATLSWHKSNDIYANSVFTTVHVKRGSLYF
jgi:hypothetical protein